MAIINTDFSKLKTGDLIIVSMWGGTLHLGFYLGRGQGESIQFYTFHRILSWYNRDSKSCKYPYKDYIQGEYPHRRITKYHPDLIVDERDKKQYYECVEILKSLKIIKE